MKSSSTLKAEPEPSQTRSGHLIGVISFGNYFNNPFIDQVIRVYLVKQLS